MAESLTYFGGKCPTCGFARRYASNRKCANCSIAPATYIVALGDVQPVLRGAESVRYLDAARDLRHRRGRGYRIWRAVPVDD